jgi:hypothetical protein
LLRQTYVIIRNAENSQEMKVVAAAVMKWQVYPCA